MPRKPQPLIQTSDSAKSGSESGNAAPQHPIKRPREDVEKNQSTPIQPVVSVPHPDGHEEAADASNLDVSERAWVATASYGVHWLRQCCLPSASKASALPALMAASAVAHDAAPPSQRHVMSSAFLTSVAEVQCGVVELICNDQTEAIISGMHADLWRAALPEPTREQLRWCVGDVISFVPKRVVTSSSSVASSGTGDANFDDATYRATTRWIGYDPMRIIGQQQRHSGGDGEWLQRQDEAVDEACSMIRECLWPFIIRQFVVGPRPGVAHATAVLKASPIVWGRLLHVGSVLFPGGFEITDAASLEPRASEISQRLDAVARLWGMSSTELTAEMKRSNVSSSLGTASSVSFLIRIGVQGMMGLLHATTHVTIEALLQCETMCGTLNYDLQRALWEVAASPTFAVYSACCRGMLDFALRTTKADDDAVAAGNSSPPSHGLSLITVSRAVDVYLRMMARLSAATWVPYTHIRHVHRAPTLWGKAAAAVGMQIHGLCQTVRSSNGAASPGDVDKSKHAQHLHRNAVHGLCVAFVAWLSSPSARGTVFGGAPRRTLPSALDRFLYPPTVAQITSPNANTATVAGPRTVERLRKHLPDITDVDAMNQEPHGACAPSVAAAAASSTTPSEPWAVARLVTLRRLYVALFSPVARAVRRHLTRNNSDGVDAMDVAGGEEGLLTCTVGVQSLSRAGGVCVRRVAPSTSATTLDTLHRAVRHEVLTSCDHVGWGIEVAINLCTDKSSADTTDAALLEDWLAVVQDSSTDVVQVMCAVVMAHHGPPMVFYAIAVIDVAQIRKQQSDMEDEGKWVIQLHFLSGAEDSAAALLQTVLEARSSSAAGDVPGVTLHFARDVSRHWNPTSIAADDTTLHLSGAATKLHLMRNLIVDIERDEIASEGTRWHANTLLLNSSSSIATQASNTCRNGGRASVFHMASTSSGCMWPLNRPLSAAERDVLRSGVQEAADGLSQQLNHRISGDRATGIQDLLENAVTLAPCSGVFRLEGVRSSGKTSTAAIAAGVLGAARAVARQEASTTVVSQLEHVSQRVQHAVSEVAGFVNLQCLGVAGARSFGGWTAAQRAAFTQAADALLDARCTQVEEFSRARHGPLQRSPPLVVTTDVANTSSIPRLLSAMQLRQDNSGHGKRNLAVKTLDELYTTGHTRASRAPYMKLLDAEEAQLEACRSWLLRCEHFASSRSRLIGRAEGDDDLDALLPAVIGATLWATDPSLFAASCCAAPLLSQNLRLVFGADQTVVRDGAFTTTFLEPSFASPVIGHEGELLTPPAFTASSASHQVLKHVHSAALAQPPHRRTMVWVGSPEQQPESSSHLLALAELQLQTIRENLQEIQRRLSMLAASREEFGDFVTGMELVSSSAVDVVVATAADIVRHHALIRSSVPTHDAEAAAMGHVWLHRGGPAQEVATTLIVDGWDSIGSDVLWSVLASPSYVLSTHALEWNASLHDAPRSTSWGVSAMIAQHVKQHMTNLQAAASASSSGGSRAPILATASARLVESQRGCTAALAAACFALLPPLMQINVAAAAPRETNATSDSELHQPLSSMWLHPDAVLWAASHTVSWHAIPDLQRAVSQLQQSASQQQGSSPAPAAMSVEVSTSAAQLPIDAPWSTVKRDLCMALRMARETLRVAGIVSSIAIVVPRVSNGIQRVFLDALSDIDREASVNETSARMHHRLLRRVVVLCDVTTASGRLFDLVIAVPLGMVAAVARARETFAIKESVSEHSESNAAFRYNLWFWIVANFALKGFAIVGGPALVHAPELQSYREWLTEERKRCLTASSATAASNTIGARALQQLSVAMTERAARMADTLGFDVLLLRCPRHYDTSVPKAIVAQTAPDDLDASDHSVHAKVSLVFVEAGGLSCGSVCMAKYPCTHPAHRCVARCHELDDEGHDDDVSDACADVTSHTSCPCPCSRILPCGHECLGRCGDACGPCEFEGWIERGCGQPVVVGIQNGTNAVAVTVYPHFCRARCGESDENLPPCDAEMVLSCASCGSPIRGPCHDSANSESWPCKFCTDANARVQRAIDDAGCDPDSKAAAAIAAGEAMKKHIALQRSKRTLLEKKLALECANSGPERNPEFVVQSNRVQAIRKENDAQLASLRDAAKRTRAQLVSRVADAVAAQRAWAEQSELLLKVLTEAVARSYDQSPR